MEKFEYQDLVGVPFKDGGRSKRTGMDCWGVASELFKRQGLMVSDYAISAMNGIAIASEMNMELRLETTWIKLANPMIGCLVAIRLTDDGWANHVGIYIGDGRFIHAYSKTGVVIDRIKRWSSRIAGYYVPKGENTR